MSLEEINLKFKSFIKIFKVSLINVDSFQATVKDMKDRIEDMERSNSSLQEILKDFELIVKERDFFCAYVEALSSACNCVIIAKNNDNVIVSVNKEGIDRFPFFNDVESAHVSDILEDYSSRYEDGKDESPLIKEILVDKNTLSAKISEVKSGFIFDKYGQFRVIKMPLVTNTGSILGSMIIMEEVTDKLILVKDMCKVTRSPGIKDNLLKLTRMIIPEFSLEKSPGGKNDR